MRTLHIKLYATILQIPHSSTEASVRGSTCRKCPISNILDLAYYLNFHLENWHFHWVFPTHRTYATRLSRRRSSNLNTTVQVCGVGLPLLCSDAIVVRVEGRVYIGTETPATLVGARGFEPPTPASRTQCATGLRYAPTK